MKIVAREATRITCVLSVFKRYLPRNNNVHRIMYCYLLVSCVYHHVLSSSGIYEAIELRDGDKAHYMGKGVSKAVDNVNKVSINK